MASTAELIVSIIGDMTKLKQTFGEVQTQIKGMSDQVKTMGKDLSSAGSSMTTGITAPILAVGASIGLSLSTATEFDTQMRRTSTMLPGITQEGFKKISDQSLALSKQFGSDTADINNAMYNALSSGIPQDNIFEFMQTAEKLAIGGATDVFTSVDGLTSVVNAYGQANLSAAKASDILFTGSKYGKATIEELARQLADVTPIAAANKVSFEDLNSVIATMTIQGTRTPVAMTQTKAILNELSQDTTQAGAAFKQLAGESFTEFIAKGGTVGQALALLNSHVGETIPDIDAMNKAVKGFEDPASAMSQEFNNLTGKSFQQFIKGGGTVQQALKIMGIESGTTTKSVADFFSNIEGKSGALQLVGEGGKLYTQTMEAMKTTTGATDAAFKTMADGMGTQKDKITAEFKAFAIEAGNSFMPILKDVIVPFVRDTFIPALNSMIPVIVSIMESFGKLSPTIQLIVIGMVGLIAAAGPLLVVIGAMASGIGAVAGLFAAGGALATAGTIISGLIAGITALGAPILVLIGVVALLAVAWRNDWGGIQEKARAVWDWITTTANTLYNRLEYTYHAMIMSVSVLHSRFSEIWDLISTALSRVWNTITTAFNTWYNNVQASYNRILALAEWLYAQWQGRWEQIKAMISTAIASIYSLLQNLLNQVQTQYNRIIDLAKWLYSQWSGRWQEVENRIQQAAATIYKYLVSLYNDVTKQVDNIKTAITKPFSTIKDTIEGYFKDIYKAGQNFVQNLIDGIENKIKDLEKEVKKITDKVSDYLPMNSPSKIGALSRLPKWDDIFVNPLQLSMSKMPGIMEAGINSMIAGPTNNNVSNIYEGSQISIGPNQISGTMDIQQIVDEINRRVTAQRRARGYIL